MKKLVLVMFCLIIAMSLVLTSCDKISALFGKDKGGTDDTGNTGDTGDTGDKDNNGGTDDTGNTDNNGGSGDQGGADNGDGGNTDEPAACTHEGALICEKCFETLYAIETLPAIPSIPAADSIGIKVTDIDMVIGENVSDKGDLTMTMTEGYVALGENGKLQGYGTAKLSVDFRAYERVNDLEFDVLIEDNVLYYSQKGNSLDSSDIPIDTVGCYKVEDVKALKELKGQLEDIQAMAEQYMPIVEAWMNETLLPLFANVNLGIAPEPDTAEPSAEELKQYAELINSFYAVTQTEDGKTEISLKLDTLKEWNAMLAEKTPAELIDLLCGEGSFAAIEGLLLDEKLYDYSVADLLGYLEEAQGIDAGLVLDAFDTLVKEISEDETATLESMLIPMLFPNADLPEDFDLNSYLSDEEFLALSVKDALFYIYSMNIGNGGSNGEADGTVDGGANGTTDEAAPEATPDDLVTEIKKVISSVSSDLKGMSVYEFILNYAQIAAEEGTDPVEILVNTVNGAIDMMEESLDFTVTLDGNKNVTNIALNIAVDSGAQTAVYAVDINSESVSVDISFYEDGEKLDYMSAVMNEEKITVTYGVNSYNKVGSFAFEIIPGYTVTPNAEKVASIKAALAEAESLITAENVHNTLAEQYGEFYSYYGYKVLYDETTGITYLAYISSEDTVDNGDGTYSIGFMVSVTSYDPAGYYSYTVSNGCGDVLAIDVTFNAEVGRITSTAVFDTENASSSDIFDLVTLDLIIPVMTAGNLEESTDKMVEMLYNKTTGECGYTVEDYGDVESNGHMYMWNEEGSKASDDNTACEEVCYDYYECYLCKTGYKSYYSLGHLSEKHYVYNESTGEYEVYVSCQKESCDAEDTCVGTVSVYGYFTEEVYSSSEYAGFVVTVDENSAGTYRVYSDHTSNVDSFFAAYILDENGELAVDEYESTIQYAYADDSSEGLCFDCEVILEAGVTYVFAFNCYGYEDANFDVYIEKL